MCLGPRDHVTPSWLELRNTAKITTTHNLNYNLPTDNEKVQRNKFLYEEVREQEQHWVEAGCPSTVREWIRTGVRVPWKSVPPAPFHQGASLVDRTVSQNEFWQQEKERLVTCGAWERGGRSDYVTKAFLVPKPGLNKWRLVVDLRHLNSYVMEHTTKFETLKNLRHLAKRGDWMFSFDLEDGYYAVAIHEDDRKYFSVEVDGETFQFVGLPMGWTLSPYIFCKTMRTLVQELRAPEAPKAHVVRRGGRKRLKNLDKRGMRVLPYVDDFLVLARTRREALRFRARTEKVLSHLGLRRNPKKGQWEPAQKVEHLGLVVDTLEGVFRVSDTRMKKISALARDIIQESKRRRRLIPVRRLAQFTGLAQSVYLAVSPARFYLRELHDVMSSRKGWSALVRVTKQAYRDLQWWTSVPAKWNGRDIWRSAASALMHCDASKTAWGGVLNEELTARSFWNATERHYHITHLELQAVYNSVRSFLPWLKNRDVLLREDNMAVVHILTNHTTRSRPMMELLRKLWFVCDTNNIDLRPQYIRSAANVWADQLSRDLDLEDWRLNPEEFRRKDSEWGGATGHTVDRFASMTSAQLRRYYSLQRDPHCEGTHSLRHDWSGEMNWVNPP